MNRQKIIVVSLMIFSAILFSGTMFYQNSVQYLAKHHLEQGYQFYEEERYETAVLSFQKAIEFCPRQIDGYVGAANAYIRLGREPEAVNALEKMSRNTMGETYRERENMSEKWITLEKLMQWYLNQNIENSEKVQ